MGEVDGRYMLEGWVGGSDGFSVFCLFLLLSIVWNDKG